MKTNTIVTKSYWIGIGCRAHRLMFIPLPDKLVAEIKKRVSKDEDFCTSDIYDENIKAWRKDKTLWKQVEENTIWFECDRGGVSLDYPEGNFDILFDEIDKIPKDRKINNSLKDIHDRLKKQHNGFYLVRDSVVKGCSWKLKISIKEPFDIKKFKRGANEKFPEFDHEGEILLNERNFNYEGVDKIVMKPNASSSPFSFDEQYWESKIIKFNDKGIEYITDIEGLE